MISYSFVISFGALVALSMGATVPVLVNGGISVDLDASERVFGRTSFCNPRCPISMSCK